MRFEEFDLLSDENIQSEIVEHLRQDGFDVLDVLEDGLQGTSDSELMTRAYGEDRVILTHDSDFGTLAVLAGQATVGIVFLRPGHIDPAFTITSLDELVRQDLELTPPFLLVVDQRGGAIAFRYRQL